MKKDGCNWIPLPKSWKNLFEDVDGALFNSLRVRFDLGLFDPIEGQAYWKLGQGDAVSEIVVWYCQHAIWVLGGNTFATILWLQWPIVNTIRKWILGWLLQVLLFFMSVSIHTILFAGIPLTDAGSLSSSLAPNFRWKSWTHASLTRF